MERRVIGWNEQFSAVVQRLAATFDVYYPYRDEQRPMVERIATDVLPKLKGQV